MSAGEEFDVMIIGAGPAGSFAAERLARGGARVALFDGRPPGEAKACGGGVTSKALKAWPQLLDAPGRTVDEVEMLAPSGRGVRLTLREPFAIYSRTAFDSHLRDRARRAGARVLARRVSASFERRDGEKWTLRSRDGEEWSAKMLVAADGANSPVARRLAGAIPNAEMEVAFGYRAPLTEGGEAPTVIAFLPGWAGYAWAFPRLDHVSFGIATAQDTFDHGALDALLWEFMVSYYARDADGRAGREQVREELRARADRYAARIPGLAPETLKTRRAVGDGWALLGDAAGFADPVTGEGIYYALRSAELFTRDFLNGRPEAYQESWRADFGGELWRASRMRRRFYGTFLGAPFTDCMVTFARLHPGVRRTLRELVAGGQGYLDLKRTLALRAVWPL
jgi:geranylgeranyl reductase family protein